MVYQGSISDGPVPHLNEAVQGSDCVVSMLGDTTLQDVLNVNAAFVRDQLVYMTLMFRSRRRRETFLQSRSSSTKIWLLHYSPAWTGAGCRLLGHS